LRDRTIGRRLSRSKPIATNLGKQRDFGDNPTMQRTLRTNDEA